MSETPNLEALIQNEGSLIAGTTLKHPSGMHSRTTRVAQALMEYAALKAELERMRARAWLADEIAKAYRNSPELLGDWLTRYDKTKELENG